MWINYHKISLCIYLITINENFVTSQRPQALQPGELGKKIFQRRKTKQKLRNKAKNLEVFHHERGIVSGEFVLLDSDLAKIIHVFWLTNIFGLRILARDTEMSEQGTML